MSLKKLSQAGFCVKNAEGSSASKFVLVLLCEHSILNVFSKRCQYRRDLIHSEKLCFADLACS